LKGLTFDKNNQMQAFKDPPAFFPSKGGNQTYSHCDRRSRGNGCVVMRFKNLRRNTMFPKVYLVDENHVNAQGELDKSYYPYYFEIARIAYFYETFGIDCDQLMELGTLCDVLDENYIVNEPVHSGDMVVMNCELEKNSNPSAFNVFQQMIFEDRIAAEGVFVCSFMKNNEHFVPDDIQKALE